MISFFPAFPKTAGNFNFPKSFHPLLCPYAVINFSFAIHKNLSTFCPPHFPLCLVPFLAFISSSSSFSLFHAFLSYSASLFLFAFPQCFLIQSSSFIPSLSVFCCSFPVKFPSFFWADFLKRHISHLQAHIEPWNDWRHNSLPCISWRLPESSYGLIWALCLISSRWALQDIGKLSESSSCQFSSSMFHSISCFLFISHSFFSNDCRQEGAKGLPANTEKLKQGAAFIFRFQSSSKLPLVHNRKIAI